MDDKLVLRNHLKEARTEAKLSQALARRGFSWDAIESAIDEIME